MEAFFLTFVLIFFSIIAALILVGFSTLEFCSSYILVSSEVKSLPNEVLSVLKECHNEFLCVIYYKDSFDYSFEDKINCITSQLSECGYFLVKGKNNKSYLIFRKASTDNNDDKNEVIDDNNRTFNVFIIGNFSDTRIERLVSSVTAGNPNNIAIFIIAAKTDSSSYSQTLSKESRNLLISCLSSKRYIMISEHIVVENDERKLFFKKAN